MNKAASACYTVGRDDEELGKDRLRYIQVRIHPKNLVNIVEMN